VNRPTPPPGNLIWKAVRNSWKLAAVSGLLVLLVFAVFGQTLGYGFVNYDDDGNIYAAPQVVAGISPRGIIWAFTHIQVGHWDPLTTISHMADCQVYGLWAGGHHLTNVLLQAAAAVLLFLVLVEMAGGLWRCGFVAAVWAIHPLRVESVAWVTERKDLLSGVFFMLTLLAYAAYARQPRSKLRYCTVGAVFILGLMSKSMLVTVPFVLLLLDYWPLKRFKPGEGVEGWRTAWRLIPEKAPLLLIAVIFAVVQVEAARSHLISVDKTPVMQRVGEAMVICAVYLRQTVWPVDLAVEYVRPAGGLPAWQFVLAIAVLGALSAGVLLGRKKQPWLVTGWLWYVGTLVPVIGIFQSDKYPQDDRYTYLPQIGVCIAGTWAAAEWAGRWRDRRITLGTVAVVILCALSAAAWQQTTYWRDSEALWTHTLGCTQENHEAQNNLGEALLQQGRTDEAMAHFQEALRIKPDYAVAHTNLGDALLRQGRMEEAMAQFQEALRIDATDAEIHNNIGNVLARQGRMDEAITQFIEALRIDPANVDAHINLGNALLWQGRTDDAIAQYREALKIDPAYAKAHYNLGRALFQQGQSEEAIAQMQRALDLQPSNPSIEIDLAWMLAAASQSSLRNGGMAVQLATQASQATGGNNPSMLRTLAAAYAQAGDFSNAVQTAQRALQLAPSNAALAGALQREIKLYKAGQPYR